MDNRWSFKKWLLQLSAPYKKSEAYKTYGDMLREEQKESVFWDPEINYVVKHENTKLRKPNSSNESSLNTITEENNSAKKLLKTRK